MESLNSFVHGFIDYVIWYLIVDLLTSQFQIRDRSQELYLWKFYFIFMFTGILFFIHACD
ncbi:hypothetical protein C2G38_2088893 [Gigaspora rosea]|uniref:Uncharacterized protein n=1 Tax=Gigaspora rosea TaxID=44941 RepID=A0A397V753_9GLOM|nr:hypothetical protein C2G38_2088893 [Gigaspora rosea]